MNHSLSGLRVLDLTRLIPGPYATSVLVQLGASVDKVEDCDAGDYLRVLPPSGELFHILNEGKRSAALDLRTPDGQAALLRILPRYDVLIESFRPGVMARLGLAHERLLEAHPKLIVCALTGFGDAGPDAMRAGHDLGYQARAGCLPPSRGSSDPAANLAMPRAQVADIGGALWAVIGILAALRERDQTGKGRTINVALADAAVPFALASLVTELVAAVDSSAASAAGMLTGALASYRMYYARDGVPIAVAALEPKFVTRLFDALGIPLPDFVFVPGPHQEAIASSLASAIAANTSSEWRAFAAAHDVCLEVVSSAGVDALGARSMLERTAHQGVLHVTLRTPLTEFAPLPSPAHGEHTREVLADDSS